MNMTYIHKPFMARRINLGLDLKEAGCKEVEGSVYTEWIWECKICGRTVYVEIPATWPLPEGPGKPAVIKMWLPANSVPSCWFHLLGERRRIGGRQAQLVCVEYDPEITAKQLITEFERRYRELCGRC